ncbi:hypothetical protein NBRC116493_01610 [Aurantivibrio infirmus]
MKQSFDYLRGTMKILPTLGVSVTGAFMALSFSVFAADYKTPRMPDGTPDLQGTWRNATATPLQRSSELGNRRAFTVEEAEEISRAAIARVEADAVPTDPNAPPPKAEALPPVGNYNLFWTDRGMSVALIDGEFRTSMIIDPPDGRIPSMTKEGLERQRNSRPANRNDGPEGRSLGERCLLSFGSLAGPPMLPTMYNPHYQIVQSPGYIAIMAEMVHDVRIIRIGKDLEHDTRQKWMGDSIGYWDGDTLVVKTTNFRPEQSFRGTSETAVITERFTRVAENKIKYRFTVEDPVAFTKPFTGELPFVTSDTPIYEYACHEGNYGLPGILQGARQEEQQAADKK